MENNSNSTAKHENLVDIAPAPAPTILPALYSTLGKESEAVVENTQSDPTTQKNNKPNNPLRKARRKKAQRACGNCQKAHMTCGDERPCNRCVRRNIGPTCQDGIRKKAKYLLESPKENKQSIPESKPSQPHIQPVNDISYNTMFQSILPNPNPPPSFPMVMMSNSMSQPYFNSIEPTNELGFFSQNAGLEYDVLSSMLNNNMLMDLGAYQGFPSFPLAETWTPFDGPVQNALPDLTNSNLLKPEVPTNGAGNGSQRQKLPPFGSSEPNDVSLNNDKSRVKAVYSKIKGAYSYINGYHYLLKYIQERMSKENVLRICKAISSFRPSFIALIMNLTEEDLVFVEKCFHRTLLEFEKLIGLSGTPTVVWRRTGEIVMVGKEFSILTSWATNDLTRPNHPVYIYELMDDGSTVNYWEKYAVHAFDNSELSVMTLCNILAAPDPTTGHQRLVPCTMCFTIKRDIFDAPLMIVGNFLPILS